MKCCGTRQEADRPVSPVWFRFLWAAGLILYPGRLPAPPPVAEEEALAALESGSSAGVSGTLHGRNWRLGNRRESPSGEGFPWHGLEGVFAYDALAMAGGGEGWDWGAMSAEASWSLNWQINGKQSVRPDAFAARVRHRNAPGGGPAPSDRRRETGALRGYVDGFNDAGPEIPDLYIQQGFCPESFSCVTVG